MEIMIYTDASVKNDKASYAFMILSDTEHIATRADVYPPVKGKTLDICSAEFRCIEQAIQFIKDMDLPEGTKVTVYSDSTMAITWARKSVQSLYDISYVHFKAHQQNHNPNKVIDSLTKGVLVCSDSL